MKNHPQHDSSLKLCNFVFNTLFLDVSVQSDTDEDDVRIVSECIYSKMACTFTSVEQTQKLASQRLPEDWN